MNIRRIKGVLWSNLIYGETRSIRALEYVLWATFTDEDARKLIGFKRITPFWGRNPGWYLYINDMSGIYELQLLRYGLTRWKEDLGLESGRSSVFSYCSFILKYYPHPDEPAFQDYNFFEKIVRLSGFFDKSGAPREDVQDQTSHIFSSYFLIGNLELHFEKENRAVCIVLNTQDRWIEYREKTLDTTPAEDNLVRIFKPTEPDRYVAGLEISWHLLDKIVRAFCYSYKASPTTVFLINSPGKICYLKSSGKIRVKYSWKYPERKLEIGTTLTSKPSDKDVFGKIFEEVAYREANLKRNSKEFKRATGKPILTFQRLYVEGFKEPKYMNRKIFLNKIWWKAGKHPGKRYVYKV